MIPAAMPVSTETKQATTWAPKVYAILKNYLAQISKPRRPHPEVLELTQQAVMSMLELSYRFNALDTCVSLSQMNLQLVEMLDQLEKWEEHQVQLKELQGELETNWQAEIEAQISIEGLTQSSNAASNDSPDSPFPITGSSGPKAKQEVTSPDNGNAQGATDSAQPGEETHNGTFHYLGQWLADFDEELVQTYMSETEDQIAQAEQLLLSFENQTHDDKTIVTLFRILHTIKGNSGLLGLQEFMQLTHTMEQYLEPVRNNPAHANNISVDLLLKGVDALNALMANMTRQIECFEKEGAACGLEPVQWQPLAEAFDQQRPTEA